MSRAQAPRGHGASRSHRNRTAVVAIAFAAMGAYVWFITAALVPNGEDPVAADAARDAAPTPRSHLVRHGAHHDDEDVAVAAVTDQHQRRHDEFDHAYSHDDTVHDSAGYGAVTSHSGKRYEYALPEVRTREIAVTQTHKLPLGLPRAGKLRILITGGAGFVGSHLVDRLLERGDSVIVVDNFFTGRKENILHNLQNPYFEVIRQGEE